MTPVDVLRELSQRGVILKPHGDKVRYRAPSGRLTPELKQALADQKAGLLQILAAKVPATARGEVVDDREVIAVKVWSDALNEAIWVAADALPRNEWPTEAPSYTYTEVKILNHVGPDTLAWVHATKVMFGADVVSAGRQSALAQARTQDKEWLYGESVKNRCTMNTRTTPSVDRQITSRGLGGIGRYQRAQRKYGPG